MAKEDVVAAGVKAIQDGEVQVLTDTLGSVFDQGLASAPVGGGDPTKIFSQEELDQKVAEVLAADELLDQEALAAAQAAAQVQIDALSVALQEMTDKYGAEHEALQGFKDKITDLQTALDLLKSLIV